MTDQSSSRTNELRATSGGTLAKTDKPPRPELSAGIADKRLIAGVIIGLLVLIIIFGFIVGALYRNPTAAQTLRDMSLILLALLNIFIAILLMIVAGTLAYLVMKIVDLVNLVNREVEPVLKKAQDMSDTANNTVKTVQSRVALVSDEAVKPVINILSTISAAKETARILFKRQSG